MAYSKDLRIRLVRAYENGEGTIRELARVFQVGKSTVEQWLKRYKETGDVECLPYRGGPTPKLNAQALEKIREIVEKQNDLTDEEIRLRLEEHEIFLGRSTVNRGIHQLGLSVKKKHSMTPKRM